MGTSLPGRRVRGFSTGRPVMAALDLFGRRWTLRVLWELRNGPLGARALRTRCDEMSSSVLYERLGELVEAGLLDQEPSLEYALTPIGRELGEAIEPLSKWSKRWARSSGAGAQRATRAKTGLR